MRAGIPTRRSGFDPSTLSGFPFHKIGDMAGQRIDGMHTMAAARELTVTAADGQVSREIAGREAERAGIAVRSRSDRSMVPTVLQQPFAQREWVSGE